MKKNSKIFNFFIIIILTSIVLYFSLKDNFYIIVDFITHMNIFYFLLAILLMFIYFGLRSLVNTILATKFNSKYKYRNAFRMEFEIALLNAITPFSTGGKPYEIFALKKNNLKLADATNVAIQNFVVYQIALILLGFVALIINNIFSILDDNNMFLKLVYIGFIVNTLVIMVLFIISFAKKINGFISKVVVRLLHKFKLIKNEEEVIFKIENYLVNFHDGTKVLLKNKLEFCSLILIQVVSLLAFYLIPVILLYGMGDFNSFGLLDSVVISAYVMLIGSFMPMPGGTGGLEYVFILFFGSVVHGPKLTAIMVLWRFITYYFGFIVGAIVINLKKKEEKEEFLNM